MLSRFAELFLFGVMPLFIGLTATPAISSGHSIFDTKWVAEDIGGHAVIDEAQSTFQIGADGKVTGLGACNRYFSDASLGDTSIKIGPIGAGMMMCEAEQMEQEHKFFEALRNARSFRLDDASKLYFADQDGREVVRFARSG